MKPKSFLKDPDAKLDYSVQWSSWLDGDTIVASSWHLPTGITLASPSPSFSDTLTTVWLSGGTVGISYEIVNRITTAAGRINDQTITILVAQR